MITYTKNKSKVETKYTLEYIDNEKDFDYLNSGRINQGEPWERFKVKKYDDIGEATAAFIIYLFKNDILFCQLLEEIIIDDKTLVERYIELPTTFANNLKNLISRNLKREVEIINEKNDNLEKEMYLYKTFSKLPACQNYFSEFIKEKSGKTVYRYYIVTDNMENKKFPQKDKIKNVVDFGIKKYIEDIGRYAFGYLEYETELSFEETRKYNLEWNKFTKYNL